MTLLDSFQLKNPLPLPFHLKYWRGIEADADITNALLSVIVFQSHADPKGYQQTPIVFWI